MKPAKQLMQTITAISEGALPLPSNYPQVSNPATQADLNMLVDWFNKEYFGGIIKEVRVKFAPLAKNFFGKCHVEFGPSYELKDLLITIATMCQKDPKNLVDTMAHEMIHAWQFTMNEKENTGKYSEVTWAEIFSDRDKHTHGHNKYFHEWAEKMNKDGFDINVESGLDTEVELTKAFYGISVSIGTEASLLVYSDKDPSDNLPSILTSIAERVGAGSFSEYTLFTTEDSAILQGTRITKTWKLPKNVINIKFPSKMIERLLQSKLTKILVSDQVSKVSGDDLKLVDNNGIDPALVQMVASIAKYRNSSFESFLQTAYYNAYPVWRRIAGNVLYSKGKKFKGVKIPDEFPEEAAEYVWKNWLQITDIEIKRSDYVKYFYRALRSGVFKRQMNDYDMKDFHKYYDKNFEMRVAKDKYLQLCFDFAWSETQKEMKKTQVGTLTREDYLRVFKELLKTTDLKELSEKVK